MRRRRLHVLPALVAVAVSLAAPLLVGGDAALTGAAGSVTARAAQADGTPGGNVRYPVGGPALESATAIAIAHWGGRPCGGDLEIAWTVLDPGTNATASWRNPTDAWNNPAANFDCRVDFNVRADFDFAKLCTVMAHELGHLAGQPHAAAAGKLMSPFYTTPLPACASASPEPSATPAAATSREADADPDAGAVRSDRRTLRRTAKASTRLVRRCVTRVRDGKRTRTCKTLRVKAQSAKRS